jgi:hypothetical protein
MKLVALNWETCYQNCSKYVPVLPTTSLTCIPHIVLMHEPSLPWTTVQLLKWCMGTGTLLNVFNIFYFGENIFRMQLCLWLSPVKFNMIIFDILCIIIFFYQKMRRYCFSSKHFSFYRARMRESWMFTIPWTCLVHFLRWLSIFWRQVYRKYVIRHIYSCIKHEMYVYVGVYIYIYIYLCVSCNQ